MKKACGSKTSPSKPNHSSNYTETQQPAHMVLAVLRPAKDKQNAELIHMDCNMMLRHTKSSALTVANEMLPCRKNILHIFYFFAESVRRLMKQ